LIDGCIRSINQSIDFLISRSIEPWIDPLIDWLQLALLVYCHGKNSEISRSHIAIHITTEI